MAQETEKHSGLTIFPQPKAGEAAAMAEAEA